MNTYKTSSTRSTCNSIYPSFTGLVRSKTSVYYMVDKQRGINTFLVVSRIGKHLSLFTLTLMNLLKTSQRGSCSYFAQLHRVCTVQVKFSGNNILMKKTILRKAN